MSAGMGIDKVARRLIQEMKGANVPTYAVADVEPPTRMELALATGITPDPWQEVVLESDDPKILMLCSRQSGKSTVSAILGMHEAAYTPGALVLMLAPSLRQSGELARTCFRIHSSVDLPMPKIVQQSALKMELENGSRLIALPGSEATTRGYAAATMLIIDEAAWVPDALIAAIRPTLATTNGRFVALSTPAGKRGWFFMEWSTGVGWHRTKVTAEDCPRISKEFLADELRSMGPHVYGQEYLCEFYDPDTSVFSSELIQRAITHEVKPLWRAA